MDIHKIVSVLLLAFGAVIGSMVFGYTAGSVPYGVWLLGIVGIGIAIYGAHVDGEYVQHFLEGFGIGFVIPAVSAVVGYGVKAVSG
jgi:hypothetical protein